MRILRVSTRTASRLTPDRVTRSRPRAFAEWQALRRWDRLPSRERDVVGYRMRDLRETAGLTQRELAGRLGVTQQAVAQAERWQSNPTVDLLRRWAAACGATVEIRLGGAAAIGRTAESAHAPRASSPDDPRPMPGPAKARRRRAASASDHVPEADEVNAVEARRRG